MTCRWWLAGTAALLAANPVQAQTPAKSYEAAVQARLNGDAVRAVALLEPLVAADPANADAQLQLGLALLALDRLDDAERAFRAVLAIAPGYDDARIGLARVAQRRGDRVAALRELEQVDVASREAEALRGQLAAPGAIAARWQFDVEGSYSTFDGPQSDWREAAIQLYHRPSAETAIGGRIEYARRFGLDDVYGEMTVQRTLSDRARAYVSIGAAANPDFRPEWQIGLGGSLRVRDGTNVTVLTLDTRQARFANGDVQSVTPGIEQYIGGRAWLTARWINLFDEEGTHRTGYLLRGDGQVTDRLRLFTGYSDAPDTDEGVVVEVRSLFGGLNYDLDSRMTLRASLTHEDRATGSDRTQFGLGLGFRF